MSEYVNMRTADIILVETLLGWNVNVIFGLPDRINGIIEPIKAASK